MFSTLARYLWSTPPDGPADDEERREMPLPLPLHAAVPMDRKPPSFTMDRSRGPSHVAWLTPNSSSPAVSRRSWPPKFVNRTSATPSSLDSAPGAAPAGSSQQPASNRHSSGSESFHLQGLYYLSDLISESENAPSTVPLPAADSPAVRFPISIRRPSTDSVPLTPDSVRPSDGHPSNVAASPATPSSRTAFVNRPLNRTISQSSTSTFGTTISITIPPVIPPLDLRPNFSGSLGLTPRRTQLQAPSLPAVVAGQRALQVSVIYEDSIDVAESFRTAQSQRSSLYDNDGHSAVVSDDDLELGASTSNPFADPEDYRRSTGGQLEQLDESDVDSQSHMSLPPGFYDEVDLGVPEDNQSPISSSECLPTDRFSHPHPHSDPNPELDPDRPASIVSVLGTISRRSHDSNSTMVERAIKRRWLAGLSFGSYRTDRDTWQMRSRARCTSACVLFFLGFIAPWCWLIGGWYLSRSGEVQPEGQFVGTVRWWWPRRRRATTQKEKKRESRPRRKHVSLFWQVKKEEREEETKPMTPVEDRRRFGLFGRAPPKGEKRQQGGEEEDRVVYDIDPWVLRCRVAAVTAGIFLGIAIVIALIVIAGVFA